MLNRTQDDVMKNWPKEWDKPVVSVRCLAYNHEPYIRKALDGFIMQETDFPFEIIVHDDASTDKTADIIREYEAKFPQIIKPIYEKENQYSKRDGSLSRAILPFLKGKYVAFCEGDDYWCDVLKLQRQKDAMECNLDCSICFHNVQVIYENGEKREGYMFPGKKFKAGVISQFEYASWLLGKAQCTFQLSSYFTKTEFLFRIHNNQPDFYRYAHVGDEKIQRFCLNEGNAYFIDDVMSCYRTQSRNSWHLREFVSKEQKKYHMEEMIKLDESYDIYSNYRFHHFIENGKKARFFDYLIQTNQYKEIFKKEYKVNLLIIPFALRMRYRLYAIFPWIQDMLVFIRCKLTHK